MGTTKAVGARIWAVGARATLRETSRVASRETSRIASRITSRMASRMASRIWVLGERIIRARRVAGVTLAAILGTRARARAGERRAGDQCVLHLQLPWQFG